MVIMKELSIEQKAKRYDEVVNEIKKLRDNLLKEGVINENGIIYDNFNRIFPELNEGRDERIRESIIGFLITISSLKDGKTVSNEDFDSKTILEWVAWLEKQGEQKPADKVEPKFKVGEWIITPENKVLQITSIEGTTYRFNHESHYWETYYCDKQCRLWTIQDAKDGDVVVDKSDGTIGIFQSIGRYPYDDPSYCFLHCRYDDGFFYADFEQGNTINSDDLIPSTKEQRDLLFQKMKEAGYEWDIENKKLTTL